MSDKEFKKNRQLAHKIPKIIFSVLAALLIWIYVSDTQGEDIDRTLPGVKVVFEGENTMRESRGLIISDAENTSVKVTLTGKRRTVSNLSAADLAAVIDLNGISKTGTYSLAPKVTYPSKTDNSAITQTVTSPGNITFYVDKLSKKTVDVVGLFNGSAAEGFSAGMMEFSPSTVVIYGPEKELAQVRDAYIEVSREGVEKSLSFASTFVLRDEEGREVRNDEITYDVETVDVTLPISAVKEVALVVDLISGAGATDSNVKWKIVPDMITLTGDGDILAGVNSISLAKIDLANVDEALTETYKIVLPNDTEAIGGEKEATLTLELGGLYKRTVSIEKSSISVVNCSEGFSADVMSAVDNVVLRGPENILKSLSDVNVRAVVDLADYGTATGFFAVPARIAIDGTTEVGAVNPGSYKVYVNITKE